MASFDWRELHLDIIKKFLLFLYSNSDRFILKGGTSLMMCYNLDRFSEDIDLDGFGNNFLDIVTRFSNLHHVDYRIAKDTDTVKRVFIHYGGLKPLKIEVSYRKKSVTPNEVTVINSIRVYTLQTILLMKLNAFNHRDKIRDLFDIVFIFRTNWGIIPDMLKYMVCDALSFKGVEQFDFLIKDQTDELIDNDKLATDFLTMYYDLGLN